MSRLAVPPRLLSFLVLNTQTNVDVYAIFRFERTHNLSLGISRLLKKCISTMLGHRMLKPCATKTAFGLNRTFKSVSRIVPLVWNGLFGRLTKRLAHCEIKLVSQYSESSSHMNNFVMETGICSMSEASNYGAVDIVLSLLYVVTEKCFGFLNAADNTEIFME